MTNETIVIKKYHNRRLYDTKSSSYINLQDVMSMIKRQVNFIVIDAKTNQDMTHATIVQIILDQESKGYSLLPTEFLKQIILLHNDSTSAMMQSFLENMAGYFAKYRQGEFAANPIGGVKEFEEIAKQNLKLFEQACGFFMQSMNKGGGDGR